MRMLLIYLINIVKIDQIPETVPTVYGNQKNINFLKHSKTLSTSDGSYSYLNINSFHNGNYQIKITDILIEEDSYLAFYDQNQNVVYENRTCFCKAQVYYSNYTIYY